MKISKKGNDANSGKAPYFWRTLKHARLAATILLVLTVASTAAAQATTHSAKLTWVDALNPTGTTYTVLRSPGLCSGTPTFTILVTGLTALTYTDTTVTPGNYCYEVEATSGGILSAPSNTVLAPVPSFAPTGLSVVVQ